MDFANEEYRRLYVRDTITWKRLGWEGQCVLMQILRKMDRSGVLELGGLPPADAVALAVGTELSNIETGLGRILHLEVLKHAADSLVWPKFVEAQTVNKTDRQRQRESRDRRRAVSLGSSTDVTKRDVMESQSVTDCHAESHVVTRGHTPSQAVTLSSAQQNSAELSRASSAPANEWIVGLNWYCALLLGGDTTQAPDTEKWRSDYAKLGRKPEAERAAAARCAANDTWVQENRQALNPGHFVQHWGKYKAGGLKTVERGPSSREQAEADRQAAIASQTARLRKEFAERIKAARDEGDGYTAEVLAAERDLRLSKIQAQAS